MPLPGSLQKALWCVAPALSPFLWISGSTSGFHNTVDDEVSRG